MGKSRAGPDGRRYPWGVEPSKAFRSFRGDQIQGAFWSPQPLGNFEQDVSPYGVRDLITHGPQWTSSPFFWNARRAEQKEILVAKGLADCQARFAIHPNMVCLKTGQVVVIRCVADK